MKQSNQTKLEKYFNQENKDPDWFEVDLRRKAEGRLDVHIDRLHIKNDLGLAIDQKKVKDLANNIYF